jgi:hypothetical protein
MGVVLVFKSKFLMNSPCRERECMDEKLAEKLSKKGHNPMVNCSWLDTIRNLHLNTSKKSVKPILNFD